METFDEKYLNDLKNVSYIKKTYNKNGAVYTIYPQVLVNKIHEDFKIIGCKNIYYIYDNGRYSEIDENFLVKLIRKYLPEYAISRTKIND